MRLSRIIASMLLGALGVTSFVAAPSILAQTGNQQRITPKRDSALSSLGIFTPAAADPRLSASLSRAGLATGNFRFTPAETRGSASRSVTVAVRARTTRPTVVAERAAAPAAVTLQPIAYNLGVSVGWKRFAIAGDMSQLDLAGQPGSMKKLDLGLSYTGKRASGRIKATTERPSEQVPRLLTVDPNYSIDVGGAYSITRNLDVTAGVRYTTEKDRLPQLKDDRRDSQAVYVGTAIRF